MDINTGKYSYINLSSEDNKQKFEMDKIVALHSMVSSHYKINPGQVLEKSSKMSGEFNKDGKPTPLGGPV